MNNRRRDAGPGAAGAIPGNAAPFAAALPVGPPRLIAAFRAAWLDYMDGDVDLGARRGQSLFHRAFAQDPQVGNHMMNRTDAVESSSLEDYRIFLEIKTANGRPVLTKTMWASHYLGALDLLPGDAEAFSTRPCPPLADCVCSCCRNGRRNLCTCYAVYTENDDGGIDVEDLDDEELDFYYEEYGPPGPILDKRSSISPAFRRWLRGTFGLDPRPGPHASDENRFTARVFVEKGGIVTCLGQRSLEAPQEGPTDDGEGFSARMRSKVTLAAEFEIPTKIATTQWRPSDREVPFFMLRLEVDVLPLNANCDTWQITSGEIDLSYGTATLHTRGSLGCWPVDNANDSLCFLHEAIAASCRDESDYINTSVSASRRRPQ